MNFSVVHFFFSFIHLFTHTQTIAILLLCFCVLLHVWFSIMDIDMPVIILNRWSVVTMTKSQTKINISWNANGFFVSHGSIKYHMEVWPPKSTPFNPPPNFLGVLCVKNFWWRIVRWKKIQNNKNENHFSLTLRDHMRAQKITCNMHDMRACAEIDPTNFDCTLLAEIFEVHG